VIRVEWAILLMFFCWIIGVMCESGFVNKRWQSEAIKRGYAHMVVTDSLTGETQFRWRDGK
jgi:hypothetical protein